MRTFRLVWVALRLFVMAGGLVGQVVPPPPRPEDSPADPDPATLQEIFGKLRAAQVDKSLAPGALALARETLRSFPDSVVLNCELGELLVEIRDRAGLFVVLQNLRLGLQKESACVRGLETQYKVLVAGMDVRPRAMALVRQGKLDEARRLVRAAQLEPREDLVIESYLDRAQTHFTNALMRVQQLERAAPSAAGEAAGLREKTLKEGREFSTLRERGRQYIFDPLATSSCRADTARNAFEDKKLPLEDFFRVAKDLAAKYPSHPDVQQIYFLALVLVGPDEALQHYGTSVLERYGKLTIPFFSQDAQYLLVLDERHRRISLEKNPEHPKNEGQTDGLRAAREFDLDYSAIRTLHQEVSSNMATLSLSEKSAALDFGDQGLAPYYALMPAIHCLWGEQYEKQATRRLGRFIARELDLPLDHVKLADPAVSTKDLFNTYSVAITVSAMVVSQISIGLQQQSTNPTVQQNVWWQQIQNDQIQSAGQTVLNLQRMETEDRQNLQAAQNEGVDSLEQQLAEEGFDEALDLDVPGYLDVLGGMLAKTGNSQGRGEKP